MRSGPQAVLLTGLFGVGKSTVAADLAEVLEGAGVAFAAIDLDWLTWSSASGPDRLDEHGMMLVNLTSVVRNYLAAGVTHFVLARSLQSGEELDSLVAAMGLPVQAVQLSVPVDEIGRRLSTDPTEARRDDLAVAVEWAADEVGSGFADVVIGNDRPVRQTTDEIVRWLGWLPADETARLSPLSPSNADSGRATRPRMEITGPVIDAFEPVALARFYERLLSWSIVEIEGPRLGFPDNDGWAKLRSPAGTMKIEIQWEPNFVRPTWPTVGGEQTMMMHLDISVDDLDVGVAWAIESGATVADHQPQPDVRVMLDPEGHPFCLFAAQL